MWNFNTTEPIYIQLIDQIKRRIISGAYKPGEKIPTSREIATSAKVNPNTVQKAFLLLEQDDLIVTDRTVGRFVTDNSEKIKAAKDEFAKKLILRFLEEMNSLGYSDDEILKILKRRTHESRD